MILISKTYLTLCLRKKDAVHLLIQCKQNVMFISERILLRSLFVNTFKPKAHRRIVLVCTRSFHQYTPYEIFGKSETMMQLVSLWISLYLLQESWLICVDASYLRLISKVLSEAFIRTTPVSLNHLSLFKFRMHKYVQNER